MKALALSAALIALTTGPALAVGPTPATPAAAAAPAAATPTFYRIDVTIAGLDDGPKATPATYALILEENDKGELHSGLNVPFAGANGAVNRQQLGVHIELEYRLSGSTLVLDGDVEISSVDPASSSASPTWRRLSARSRIPVIVGSPTLFASLYDLSSKHRYEVTVSAKPI